MQIHGLNKTTLLDYPKHLAASIFTGGCSFRCPFCQNAALVLSPEAQPVLPEEEVLSFLQKRAGILEGVCITGGEPTLQPDLPDFIRKLRSLSLLVKLDTNGCRPDMLELLFRDGLLDYAAMDIKSSPENYGRACGFPAGSGFLKDSGSGCFRFSQVERSVMLIRSSGVPYEFRTTAVRELISRDDFLAIGEWLDGSERYYLQGFENSGDLIAGDSLSGYSRPELEMLRSQLAPHFGLVELRGIG